ncbi:MAG: hypothetical protein RL748_3643 [Pseudomonadota bacterium]|jgi:HlyD family secretion protein
MIREPLSQDHIIAAPAWWRSKKVWLSMLALCALVGTGVTLLSGWSNHGRSISLARLQTAQVTRGTLVRDALVNGRLVAANSPTLFAPAAATVTLTVKAGDTVKKGQTVAQLASPELSNTLKREHATLLQLEAEVARQQISARKQKLLARRDADQAEIERVAAERTYQRIEAAGVAGVIAKIDFLKAQDALKSAEIRAKHAEQATRLEQDEVELGLKTRVSQLQQQKLVVENAQRRVDELTLRSPLDGMVGTLAVTDRAVVAANSPLMTLVDLSQLEVELEVPESYVADIGLGLQVELAINGATSMAVLSAMSPEVVNNKVLARARFASAPPAGLRQSQRLNARLLIEQKANVLMLQRGSFIEQEGGHYAYVLNGDVASRTPITLGATSVNAVEIIKGLKPGDKVVIAGTDQFEHANHVIINP